MKKRFRGFKAPLLLLLPTMVLTGCASRGAPSFVLFGAYFPAWMLCALIGIFIAFGARIGFVTSGLSQILPYQLFVCTSIGVIAALLIWLFWFGH